MNSFKTLKFYQSESSHINEAMYLEFNFKPSLIQSLRTQALDFQCSLFSSMQPDKYQNTILHTLQPPQLKFKSYFFDP
jgi:hypothetical protein